MPVYDLKVPDVNLLAGYVLVTVPWELNPKNCQACVDVRDMGCCLHWGLSGVHCSVKDLIHKLNTK